MGKRGPPRTPTPILESRGSWLAKTRRQESKSASASPRCPAWLSKADETAASFWKKVMPVLASRGVVGDADEYAIAMMCRYYSLWQSSTEAAGKSVFGSTEWRRIHSVAREAYVSFLSMSQRFGMTPSDRAGLPIDGNEKSVDRFEIGKLQYFDGTG